MARRLPLRVLLRNLGLLSQAVRQHAMDDPVLLMVQASRRLPYAQRHLAGAALRRIGAALPADVGIGAEALGAEMTGDAEHATRCVERAAAGSRSRLAGEVAVMLDRPELVAEDAPVTTRARAAWSRGRIDQAIETLERGGAGSTRYAARLRSERRLLGSGYHLDHPLSLKARAESAPSAPHEAPRVLHILTNSLPHTTSGYSLRSHRILCALRARGVESVAMTRTGYPVMVGQPFARDVDVVDGIEYRRVLPSRLGPTQEHRLLHQVAEVVRVAEQLRPDVIHTTTNYTNTLIAEAASRATGIPWVLEVRGLMEQTWVAGRRTSQARKDARESQRARLTSRREGELAARADAVVTLSETMRAELVGRGVRWERITLLPNGVDERLFEHRESVAEARSGLGIPAERFLVGAASALVDYEGFDVLIRAVARIVESEQAPARLREQIGVMLIGDGVARPGLELLAEQLGIADRVHMPGRVAPGMAPRWVQALDLVCVPRLSSEVTRTVTPQKPVEAMALRRPVVMSDLPALRETATTEGGGSAAQLFPAGDHSALASMIIALAESETLRLRLVESGYARAQTRRWSDLVARYDGVYDLARSSYARRRRLAG